MRLQAALSGDLRRIVRDELRGAQRAVVAGLRDGGKGLRDDLRGDVEGAGLGKLGRAWAVRVYRNQSALDAAALVFPKGKSARAALWAFEHGAVIRPVNGRYLAIPTLYNRSGGRRGGKVLYAPQDLKDSFVVRSRDGNLLLMARVQHAQTLSGKDRAYVNSRLLGSGRKRRTAEILRHGVVPMFILRPQIRLNKRLNVAGIARRWEARTADLIVKHWNASNGGGNGG